MSSTLKFIILIAFLVSGCSLDLVTKEQVKQKLQYDSVPVIDNYFDLTYTENHAIAFGFFKQLDRRWRMPLIFLLPVLSTFFFFFLIWKFRDRKFSLLLPIFIILAGAYGNILDRAMNGFVTDFLHVHYYYKYNFYVFNVADVLVNIGLILMLLRWRKYNELLNEVFAKEKNAAPAAIDQQTSNS